MKLERAEQRVLSGVRLEADGLPKRAEREYRAALDIAPRHLVALNNLALLYAARGRFAEAAPLLRRATLAHPQDISSHINLAGALRELGDAPGATDGFLRALAIEPTSRLARLNLANLLRSEGRLDEARPHYQILLRQDPRDRLAGWNLAALEGLAGDLQTAFAGFARYHQSSTVAPPPPIQRWEGEPLDGRRILLDADQGLGDTVMFARFATAVRDLGGRAILRAQPDLEVLLAGVDGVESFARSDRAAPAADLWFPLVDLPAVLGPASLSANLQRSGEPYLRAPPERLARWASRLPNTSKRRVGLVWAGNPAHPDDRNRSLALEDLLAPLAGLEEIELVSIQKGAAAAQAESTALIRVDLDIEDFADTAAALSRIDLLISVDTSVLHLAGALGRPAWGLIPHAPDWRWMLERSDSPWYPSLTLLRQAKHRDWTEVIGRIARALRTGSLPT